MPSVEVVDLSRLQFAVTALYHFLFVPLTLGLSWILVIMESVYVMTGREIYRDMTKFWGKLFGINFAMGVTTGITMEFQFGTNWAYFSHYVGDIFGAPLALEGLMAFFLESTFVGLFFFGWDRLGKVQHLVRDVPRRARLQPVGAVDPDRQRVDAESGRRRVQRRHDADGAHELRRAAVQSRRRPEVRAHARRGLRRGVDVRARHLVVLPAAPARPVVRRALVRRRRGLRPRLGACRSSCWATNPATRPAKCRR